MSYATLETEIDPVDNSVIQSEEFKSVLGEEETKVAKKHRCFLLVDTFLSNCLQKQTAMYVYNRYFYSMN